MRRSLGSVLAASCATAIGVACGGSVRVIPAPVADAGPDAHEGIAPDPPKSDAGPSWCSHQGAHAFCADFDLAPDAYTAGWDYDHSSDLAVLDVVASDRSAPYALHVDGKAYQPDGGFGDPSAYLDKQFLAIDPSNLHVAFDVRIDALGVRAGDASPVGIMGIGVYASATSETVGNLELEVSLTGTTLYPYFPGTTSFQDAKLQDIPRGRWVRVDVTMTGTPQATHVDVKYDGMSAGSFDFGAGTYRGDLADVSLGALRPYRPEATSIAFDDVVLDL